MSERLIPAPAGKEFLTRERCFITERVNDPRVPDVSLARCRVAPGVVTELHSLSVREYYVISSGHGLMELDRGEPFAVGPGDTVEIPAGTAQRIHNRGETDLVFQCICLPRFTPDCYQPLE